MMQKAKKQRAMLRYVFVAVVAMSAVQTGASQPQGAQQYGLKGMVRDLVSGPLRALFTEMPRTSQGEQNGNDDTATILKTIEWSDRFSGDRELLRTNPGEAYKLRNEIIGTAGSITGHNGRFLGWEKSPQAMHMFTKTVAASIVQVASQRKNKVRVLSLCPEGVFTDLVVLADVWRQNPTFDIEYSVLPSECNGTKNQVQELTDLAFWAATICLEAKLVVCNMPACVRGSECRTCKGAYFSNSDQYKYDVLYSCNATDPKRNNAILRAIAMKRRDALAIMLALEESQENSGIVLRTIGSVPRVDREMRAVENIPHVNHKSAASIGKK